MKALQKCVNDKEMTRKLRNRESARKSIEKKKQELEALKEENIFLKNQNKILIDKIHSLEKSHSLPLPFDLVQRV